MSSRDLARQRFFDLHQDCPDAPIYSRNQEKGRVNRMETHDYR
jgi:hypothetical protein